MSTSLPLYLVVAASNLVLGATPPPELSPWETEPTLSVFSLYVHTSERAYKNGHVVVTSNDPPEGWEANRSYWFFPISDGVIVDPMTAPAFSLRPHARATLPEDPETANLVLSNDPFAGEPELVSLDFGYRIVDGATDELVGFLRPARDMYYWCMLPDSGHEPPFFDIAPGEALFFERLKGRFSGEAFYAEDTVH